MAGIGQLPRLVLLTLGGIREWSDQAMQRLEFLFASPRQIGIAEIIQFQAIADTPGYLTIPTPQGNIILQWGSGTITYPAQSEPVTFPIEYASNAWVAFAISAESSHRFPYGVNDLTTTGFTAWADNGGDDSFYWFSIGN